MKFTEAHLESAIIELLGEEGYPHVAGESLERHSQEVLIKDDLRAFLTERYAGYHITEGEIEAVIRRLDALPAADLYESNKRIHKLISDGFLLKREDHTQKDLYIQLIDYAGLAQSRQPNPASLERIVAETPPSYGRTLNRYRIVSQLEITGNERRIPDLVLYINGLPLVVFEFKSAIREDATIHNAYVQLTTRYTRDIPELMKYNAFCVISDGVNSRMGSLFAPYEYYYSWGRSSSSSSNPHPRPLSQGERGEYILYPRLLSQGEKGVSYRGNFVFSGLVEKVRELRQKQTPAEKVMWAVVRNRKLAGLKFRRQHQIGPYIVDFFCNEKKLVVELDGDAHEAEAQQKKDKKREAYLRSLGFTILRFENHTFLENPETVLQTIAGLNVPSPHSPENEPQNQKLPSPYGRGAGGEGSSLGHYSLVQGLFNQLTLLEVIRNFIYFPDVSKQEVKVLCRYPQFYAALKLYENIKAHRKPIGDGKGGTYFGATGCGKSYTMLFLTRLLMKSIDFESPTIVLITDRVDLDNQLSAQFTNAKAFLGDQTVISVESRDHLRELLKDRTSGGVFLTTVHKFTEDTELLTERSNVICISDEAHRSQVNLDQKVRVTENGVKRSFGFAKYLHDSLPNATYVGFTGTPIDATLDVFGDVVDSYTMTESVKDKITVRIVYEGRAAKVLLDNAKLEEIEDYYAQCAEDGTSEYQIEASKKATANMNAILGDPDRIKALAADFVNHYERRIAEGGTVKGKAMFVCSKREIAYAFWKALIALRPEWNEQLACEAGAALSEAEKKTIKPMERVKMIMTRSKDDPKELYDLLGSSDYRKELDRQFKNEKSNFKIAILVDMWLTGFDVPFLDTIYIDKPVQRHNLIQTISRVNRRYEDKEKGLVVDYIGIKRQMNLALAHYNNADKQNIEEIDQSIVVVRDHLDLLTKMFHKFDTAPYFNGTPLEQLDCLNQAAEYAQVTEKIEKRFMQLVKRMKAAYDICCGSELLTQAERDQIHFYLAVRSIIAKLTKGNAPDVAQMNANVRKMIAEALKADGVEEIFKMGEDEAHAIDLFDDDYLSKIEKIKLPNTKIKLLQQLLSKVISDYKKVNRAKGVDFSRRFKALVDAYNERNEEDVLVSNVLEDFTDEILDLLQDLKTEMNSFADMGIDLEEKAFYDILKGLACKYDFEYPEDKLIVLAKAVKTVVDDKARYTDWNCRDDIKAELKADLIILLAEHKYPPVDRDEVYKEIFEQAENFKKHRE